MAECKKIMVGLGEILWDLLPGGKQLGGAPANFSYMCNLLGEEGAVASRIGQDALGAEARRALERSGVPSAYIQIDSAHPTGTVNVEVHEDGQPEFEIMEPVAWDFLQWTPQWQELAQRADAVCFGSLAQRNGMSRQTIKAFVSSVRPDALRIFDVNLRQKFYSAEVLAESLRLAHIVKLNHEELPVVMDLLKLPRVSEAASAEKLRMEYGLTLVCVTRGAQGSILVGEEGMNQHPGFEVQVVDTVGAGDAFTAGLVYCYLRRASLEVVNTTANRLGSLVAAKAGGTPNIGAEDLQEIRRLMREERTS